MDAYLAVNSLALLGFNTDNYPALYEGLAYIIKPLTINTFKNENEIVLLCALHFLLIRLDFVNFIQDTKSCWPFLDMKGRNLYKRAIHTSLERISIKYNQSFDLSTAFWTLHNCAKEEEIWSLLRSLGDLCLNLAIEELLGTTPTTSSIEIDSQNIVSSMKNGHDTTETTNVVTNNNNNDDDDDDVETDYGQNLLIDDDNTELSKFELQNDIKEEILIKLAKQQRQREYMDELDQRYKKAKGCIDTYIQQQQQLNTTSTSNNNGNDVVNHQFTGGIAQQQKNIEKLNKLKNSVLLLKELVNSALLEKGITYLSIDNIQHQSGGRSNPRNNPNLHLNEQNIEMISSIDSQKQSSNESNSNNNNNNNNNHDHNLLDLEDKQWASSHHFLYQPNNNKVSGKLEELQQAVVKENTICEEIDHLMKALEHLSSKHLLLAHE